MSSTDEKIQSIVNHAAPGFSDNDAAFLRRIYGSGLEPYMDRLRVLGFEGKGRVLDAGCGFGQWSLSMAELNDAVVSIDVANNRIQFLQEAAETICPGKVEAHVGSVGTTDLPDASFDAVFCYGVVFLTPWKESLAEFARLLSSGGTLYVNANGLGWYKHLWYNQPNPAKDYDPKEHAAKVLMNTWQYGKGEPVEPGMDILIEPDEMVHELRKLGFDSIRSGGEGTLRVNGASHESARPFFQAEYLGDIGVYEVLAIRNSD